MFNLKKMIEKGYDTTLQIPESMSIEEGKTCSLTYLSLGCKIVDLSYRKVVSDCRLQKS